MSTGRRVACVLFVTAVACRHESRRQPTPVTPPPAVALAAETTVIGTVHVLGSDPRPQVVLQTQDEGRWALVGPLSFELAQLAGARVSVRGRRATQPRPYTSGIVVQSYDVLDVAGAKPIVGELRSGERAFFVDTTRLASLPSELARAIGAKVWVVGRPRPEGLVVTAYGILSLAAGADTTRR